LEGLIEGKMAEIVNSETELATVVKEF